MPRDGSGNYSLPPGSAAVSGATASSTAFNTMINDLASALTGSVPRDGTGAMTGPLKTTDGTVSAPSFAFGSSANTGWYKTATGFGFAVGGTLITEVRAAGLYDGSGNAYATGSAAVTWTDVASASTTDLGAVASANLRITGTTTINSFGTSASGLTREIRFAGALTLTYNATSMILPGVTSITTAANDTCVAVSLGSGNWIVVSYTRASGLTLVSEIPSQGGNSGKFLTTNGSALSWGLGSLTQGTTQNTTSGTNIDFNSLPAGIKRITVMMNGVSSSGTNAFLVQIGAGSVTTSGYSSLGGAASISAGLAGLTSTAGFCIVNPTATNTSTVIMTIASMTGNVWVSSHVGNYQSGNASLQGSGSLSLGGTLDRVRLTTVGGTDTFDAGSINIMYE